MLYRTAFVSIALLVLSVRAGDASFGTVSEGYSETYTEPSDSSNDDGSYLDSDLDDDGEEGGRKNRKLIMCYFVGWGRKFREFWEKPIFDISLCL